MKFFTFKAWYRTGVQSTLQVLHEKVANALLPPIPLGAPEDSAPAARVSASSAVTSHDALAILECSSSVAGTPPAGLVALGPDT